VSDVVYFQVHAALEGVQAREPWHRKLGSKDKQGRPIPIDEICRDCPSRRPCWKLSIALGDISSKRITDEQALLVVAGVGQLK
jgi:hypothetical protein